MTIKVTVSILFPDNNFETIRNLLDKEFQSFNPEINVFDDITYYIFEINNEKDKNYFEGYLDHIRNEHHKLRYIIKIYEPNKNYPSSIRINKNYQKIITKQQTKLIGF